MTRPLRRSRRVPTPLAALLVVLALSAATACASSTAYPGSIPRTSLTVDNSRSTLSSMTVNLLTPDGGRIALGTVKLNEAKTFALRRTLQPGAYRLEARGTRRVVSTEFRLDTGDLIEWDLRRNRIQFQGRDSGV
jgi:hypothetical protein